MVSTQVVNLTVILIVIALTVSWTGVDGAACAPMRCDNGTAKSNRCKVGADMDVCFGDVINVPFKVNFAEPPQLHYGVAHVDMVKGLPQRTGAFIMGVTAGGFDIKFSCDKPSFCFGTDVNWIACGVIA